MIKMECQGLSSKIQDMNLHEYLCHKFMTDEGPAFRKKVCGLKTPTGETNVNPTFKELLNLAALEYRESVMVADGKNKVNQTAGGGNPRREKVKKKEGFIKCYCCGANGHKLNACTMEKANLTCTFCGNTGSHNTQACRKKEAGEKNKKSPAASPHRARSQSPSGGRRSQTPAAALSTNSATIRHNLNRVTITYHKDVKDMSYTVNNTVKSSGNLRKLIAKLSALRTGKTCKETITLDSGASCSLLRLNIAQKLNLNLRPAPGVTITGAGGESLEVSGQTDVFFSIFDNKPVRLHLFVSPDLYEDVLISADHLEALALIPPKWPHCLDPRHKDYSANYMANSLLQEKKEEEEDSGMESEEEEDPATIPIGIPRTRVNLDEELWQDNGEVHNIPKLDTFPEETRQILLKYGDVFKSSLSKARKMKTEPIKLEIDPDIPRPHPATKCRTVPLHWQDSLDELLDSLIAEGVIVPQEGATDFVAPSFLVAKPHDPSRGCLVQDYSDGVNKCLKRLAHPIPSPFQVWQKVHPASTCFFSVDLSASYFQIPIAEESQPLTTFLTPRGKFQMTRLSMGLSASSDQFNQRVGGILDNFPNLSVVREIDDLLGHAPGLDQLNKELELLLKICREHHLTLSPKKFAMATEDSSLIFAGHQISSRGCEPDPERMTAISEFPCPESRKHLQSLFGLVAQFHSWSPDTATATRNMRKLLSAKVAFQWNEECEQEFIGLKEILTSPLFLRPFDPNLETTFTVDTSNLKGMGFLLSQEDEEGKTSVVRCGSIAAKKSWKTLSPIESEAMGICWVARSLDYYLRGAPKVRCIIDHCPLQTLMTAPLESLSLRMLHVPPQAPPLPHRIHLGAWKASLYL